MKYKVLVQFHYNDTWYQVGEIHDLSHLPDLADLIRIGTVEPIEAKQSRKTTEDKAE